MMPSNSGRDIRETLFNYRDFSSIFGLHHLILLQKSFTSSDENGAPSDKWQKSLSKDEFTVVLQKLLCKSNEQEKISVAHIHSLFDRIDTNSDNVVDWEEWVDFFLIMDQGALNLQHDAVHCELGIPLDTRDFISSEEADSKGIWYNHRQLITQIIKVENPSTDTSDFYLTSSRDGTVKWWSDKTLCHERTIDINANYCKRSITQKKADKKIWIADICYLPLSYCLAVASSNRTVSIFDLRVQHFVKCKTFDQLRHIPSCIHTFKAQQNSQVLLFGDMGGYLTMKIFPNNWYPGSSIKISSRRFKIHSDWISQVCYIASKDCIISASLDGTVVFCSKQGKVLRTFNNHKKGVYAFVYSHNWNFIASCGVSRPVLVWDPTSHHVVDKLSGHQAPVHKIVLDEKSQMLITLSVDKNIKIWNCVTFQCNQSVFDNSLYKPENKLSAMMWDKVANQLVAASSYLTIWPIRKIFGNLPNNSHDKTICAVAYSSIVNQIVSADAFSCIHVWDLETGKLVMRVPKAHGNSRISAIVFDDLGRRFISGAADGTIFVWNASNGQRISELVRKLPIRKEKNEVTSLLFICRSKAFETKRYIAATGWDLKIQIFIDSKAFENHPDVILPRINCLVDKAEVHKNDILNLTYCPDGMIASCCCEGIIVIWDMETGRMRYKLTHPCQVVPNKIEQRNIRMKNRNKIEDILDNDFEIEGIKGKVLKAYTAVECVVSLTQINCLVSGSASGQIVFWSTRTGYQVYEISTNLEESEYLSTMSLNKFDESQLMIGDSSGRIELYSLKGFHTAFKAEESKGKVPNEYIRKYPPIRKVSTWKAHSDEVVALDFVRYARQQHLGEGMVLCIPSSIISAGKDSVISLWSKSGTHISTFGQSSSWGLNLPKLITASKAVDSYNNLELNAGTTNIEDERLNKTDEFRGDSIPCMGGRATAIRETDKYSCCRSSSPRVRRIKNKPENNLELHMMIDIPRDVKKIMHCAIQNTRGKNITL